MTPRPRINLVLYYGVLGARSAWRARLRGGPAPSPPGGGSAVADARPTSGESVPRRRANLLWAALMVRSFGFDVLACPRCGDRLRLVALIESRPVIERILAHLGLPTAVPAARPSRAPPLPFDGGRSGMDDGGPP